jgi:hypothetical protein
MSSKENINWQKGATHSKTGAQGILKAQRKFPAGLENR